MHSLFTGSYDDTQPAGCCSYARSSFMEGLLLGIVSAVIDGMTQLTG